LLRETEKFFNVAREKREVREQINGIEVRLDNLLLMQSHSSRAATIQHMVKSFETLTKEKADLVFALTKRASGDDSKLSVLRSGPTFGQWQEW
jgi:hypothetical protein